MLFVLTFILIHAAQSDTVETKKIKLAICAQKKAASPSLSEEEPLYKKTTPEEEEIKRKRASNTPSSPHSTIKEISMRQEWERAEYKRIYG